MARIRTIKPEFFRSETNSQMPMRTRLTYIGLWTECDDHGRMRDNARLIKGAIWPLDNVTPKDIEVDLNTLADCGKIIRYEVAGRSYLAVTNWDDHQAAAYRRGEAKYPGPDKADRIGLAHSTSEESVQDARPRVQENANRTSSRAGTGNREQGTGYPSSASADASCFDEFWETYPRKVGKKAARRKWDTAVKDIDAATIIAAAKLYAEHVTRSRTETRFIANPETWLNQGRWDDDLHSTTAAAGPGGTSSLWKGADL